MEASAAEPVIAISGLNRGESPQPGGAVIQSIRAHFPKARFVGISYDPLETGLFSLGEDRVDTAYLFPFPGAGSQDLLKRLQEVHEKEHLDLIIPTLDSELNNYIALQDKLEEMGIELVVPRHSSLAARAKLRLVELGERADVKVPRTFASHTAEGLAWQAAQIGYPCYVKGPLYEAKLVHDEPRLIEVFTEIHNQWGGPIMVQQEVSGEEYDIAAVGDGEGGIVGSVAVRKLLRSKLGKAFGGVVVNDPGINGITDRLVRALKWRGPLEIELVQPRGQPHFLVEINPRFPAWISFAAKTGVNLPAWVAAKALGHDVPDFQPCPPGRMFVRHCADIVTDISHVADLSIDLGA